MTAAARPKASDKQGICKKLIALLKKRYQATAPHKARTVLDTMLHAICLENCSHDEADASLERLMTGFHDLNEIRVSSVTELASVFSDVDQPDWRAAQARGVLQFIFEKNFAFEFESLRKKTMELAVKQLAKIRDLSPYVRAATLQEALDSHTMPVDLRMCQAAAWLGLSEPGQNEDDTSATLKPVIRKHDAPQFLDLLRALATDRAVRDAFDPALHPPPPEGYDVATAPARLAELLDKAGPPLHTAAEAREKERRKAARRAAAKPASAARSKPKTHRPGTSPASKAARKQSGAKSTRPRSRSSG